MWTSKPYQNMYSLVGYGLLTPPPTSQQSHPASNNIFLLARFTFVGSISLQALQMNVLILLHTLAAQIAFQILLHCE